MACPCHAFSRLFMKIVHGDCGHIKARWDNHQNCLSCSSCSRLSTCSTCSRWSEETWILVDRRRKYSTRRSVMRKKKQNQKKRLAVNSDPSDDNSFDGSITPPGYTAKGCCVRPKCKSASHWSPVNQALGIYHWSTRHRSTSHQSSSHHSF